MERLTIGHIVACILIGALGILFVYGAMALDLGSARNLGPGYFPLALGCILVGLAAVLLFFDRMPSEPDGEEGFSLRPFAFVVIALLSFGAIVPSFGLLPAVFAATLAASAADRRTTLTSALVTSLTVSALSWIVFKLGLGLPVPALRISDQWIF